jgi:hypothetical protein
MPSKENIGHCLKLDSSLCVILELATIPVRRIMDGPDRTPTAGRNPSVSGSIGFVVQDWWSPYQGKREALLTEVQGVD